MGNIQILSASPRKIEGVNEDFNVDRLINEIKDEVLPKLQIPIVIDSLSLYNLPNEIKIAKLKYFNFVEPYLKNQHLNTFKYNPPFADWLHVIIRALFDSMFYEMIFNTNLDNFRVISFSGFLKRICFFLAWNI